MTLRSSGASLRTGFDKLCYRHDRDKTRKSRLVLLDFWWVCDKDGIDVSDIAEKWGIER